MRQHPERVNSLRTWLNSGKGNTRGTKCGRNEKTEVMTRTPGTENIESIQRHGRNGRKFKHTRYEEDKMADISKQENRKPNWINNCTCCSTSHNKSNCPAYNKNCRKCGKCGYFAKMCKRKNKNPKHTRQKSQ